MISKIGDLNIVETNDNKRSILLEQIDIKNIIDLVTKNKELFVVLVEVFLNRYVLPFEMKKMR
ncbi:hypothetical protein [Shouchella miscanthi]|uniref:Uncharacterized protein n=1 Tax=Shouchella miscanthi TaxID=2598861 RepID=A0ABU6NLQ4_9BACI|nr:hypothetical protein [Shouchella miscanthi]